MAYADMAQGFLNINKPSGLTSHDVVARIRRLVGRTVKVGHAGTLDPLATGVLPLALAQATRLIEYLVDARKGYHALIRLGITTTTDDAEGEALEHRPIPQIDEATLETVLTSFRGTTMQIPPMYAALHHQGKRLYELAREGKSVVREPRAVTITKLELTREWPHPDVATAFGESQALIALEIECSKGTYIRALARDIGVHLGCGAYLAQLERTFVGPFSLAQATPLAALEQDPELISQVLLPIELAVADRLRVVLNAEQTRRVTHGLPLMFPDGTPEHVCVLDSDAVLLALMRRDGAVWRPEKVFCSG